MAAGKAVENEPGEISQFMNNRELLIQQRLLMVEKEDFDTAYHEVIESQSSKYVALYSLTSD